jgi:zinc D-Ala-D-Ala dipeptidase
MILLSDRRVAAIRVGDNGEELVDVRAVPELRLDGRLADAAGAYAHLRESVVERLLAAQRALPGGLRLLLVEGYRPLSLQTAYFEDYEAKVRLAHPEWDADRVHVEASKYVSPPDVAPHSTGGTIDLTLCSADGVEQDMGTPVNATPIETANACFTASSSIPDAAQANRRILGRALADAGMVNYPTEWWHWSYGERYWALQTGAGRTRFGPADLRAPASRPAQASVAL